MRLIREVGTRFISLLRIALARLQSCHSVVAFNGHYPLIIAATKDNMNAIIMSISYQPNGLLIVLRLGCVNVVVYEISSIDDCGMHWQNALIANIYIYICMASNGHIFNSWSSNPSIASILSSWQCHSLRICQLDLMVLRIVDLSWTRCCFHCK